ncbi:hypothetical protein ACFFSW_34745 [Saccharothrix longispora]|uniref:PPE family protein n=1 Tax=Saccharothrix longispora TaxID=33920 RepID=A0ABU1PN97_9PSEU|nr:hypothetical protein [Saccharothrix longispora]MDR6591688.1 hypothetical protein [Saccharothrix longispora]
MKQQVETNFNPGLGGEIAEEWKAIGRTFTQLAVDFQVIVSGSEAGWTGSAGEGARTALAKVGKFSDMTGDHFTSTGDALHDQVSAASGAKARMPEPVEYDPKKMFTDAIGRGNVFDLAALAVTMPMRKAESEAAKAEAVQVMQARDDAMRSATGAMPAFAETPTVTQDQGTSVGTTRTSSVTTATVAPESRIGTTGVPNSGVPSGVPNNGTPDGGGTTRTSWAAPPTVAPPPSTPPVNLPPQTTPTPPTTPPWTSPPGRNPRPPFDRQPPGKPLPPGVRPPGAGTPPRRGPGGVPGGAGGGRPGLPGGVPGGGAHSGGAPGGPGGMRGGRGPVSGFGPMAPGGQSGFGPTGGAAAANQGGAGGRGAAGVAGGVGGGQGQGDEDQEHKAKYLIPTDDYFDDDRLVAPPTIGE